MALLTVLLTLLAFPAALFLWTAKSLADNTAKAKATGLPILVRWISPINPFWLLWGSSFVRLCKRWGIATESLKRIYSYGWEANERANIHVENGDVLMVVHPGGMQLCVANADVIYEILRRRSDFRRNMEEMSVLNVYGKNLSTTDDAEWQRHRKMTAITFTEKNNELVWYQSLSQTKGMLEYWTQRAEQPVRTTHLDTKVFTLNVLAASIFNKVYPFEGQAEEKLHKHADDTSYTYRESLNTILGSIIQIFIFGEEGLKSRWLPKSWNHAAEAMDTFRSYIFGLMNEERAHIAEGKIDNQHLVARLVAAQQEEEEEDTPNGIATTGGKIGKKMNMTEQEILSNLFVYAFAGNDTTAISLTNLLAQLAANPETQEWMAEEINHYLPKDGSNPTYDTFPKLKRCGAVIMETLRVTHPLSQLVKTTNNTPQPLKFGDTTYMIPAGTSVHCSLPALHAHPRYWGPTPLAWNPRQHISTATSAPHSNSFEAEALAADTSDHFIPWAWGQRVCPGKRFSQVELVAALAALFKDWRVQPEPNKGETMDQARKRVWTTSLDTDHQGHMLHEMVNPESVGLKWVKAVP